jgi:hypothetical protein
MNTGRPESMAEAIERANAERVMWWSSSSGRVELAIAKEDAMSCAQPGKDADEDVTALRAFPYMAEQLATLNPEHVRAELREYGAWNAKQLADDDENLQRLVWCACTDLAEEVWRGEG